MNHRDDIYTIVVGLGLVIYGASQIVFKEIERRRWQRDYKARMILERPTTTANIPDKER